MPNSDTLIIAYYPRNVKHFFYIQHNRRPKPPATHVYHFLGVMALSNYSDTLSGDGCSVRAFLLSLRLSMLAFI